MLFYYIASQDLSPLPLYVYKVVASCHSFDLPAVVLALFGPLTLQTLLQLPEELRKQNKITLKKKSLGIFILLYLPL